MQNNGLMTLVGSFFNQQNRKLVTDSESDTEEESNEESFLLMMLLPYAMMFFNTTQKRIKTNVNNIAQFLNCGSWKFHFLEEVDEEKHNFSDLNTEFSLKTGDVECNVKIRISYVDKLVYIYDTSNIVNYMHTCFRTYFPEEWSVIDVTTFFELLKEYTQPGVKGNVDDI